MKTILDHKKNFLCVLTESEIADGPGGAVLVREWHRSTPRRRRRSGRWWDARSPRSIQTKEFT